MNCHCSKLSRWAMHNSILLKILPNIRILENISPRLKAMRTNDARKSYEKIYSTCPKSRLVIMSARISYSVNRTWSRCNIEAEVASQLKTMEAGGKPLNWATWELAQPNHRLLSLGIRRRVSSFGLSPQQAPRNINGQSTTSNKTFMKVKGLILIPICSCSIPRKAAPTIKTRLYSVKDTLKGQKMPMGHISFMSI